MYTNFWDPNNGTILISKDQGKTFASSPLPFKVGGNMPGRGLGEVCTRPALYTYPLTHITEAGCRSSQQQRLILRSTQWSWAMEEHKLRSNLDTGHELA